MLPVSNALTCRTVFLGTNVRRRRQLVLLRRRLGRLAEVRNVYMGRSAARTTQHGCLRSFSRTEGQVFPAGLLRLLRRGHYRRLCARPSGEQRRHKYGTTIFEIAFKPSADAKGHPQSILFAFYQNVEEPNLKIPCTVQASLSLSHEEILSVSACGCRCFLLTCKPTELSTVDGTLR